MNISDFKKLFKAALPGAQRLNAEAAEAAYQRGKLAKAAPGFNFREAAQHFERAVQLAPGNAVYLDAARKARHARDARWHMRGTHEKHQEDYSWLASIKNGGHRINLIDDGKRNPGDSK